MTGNYHTAPAHGGWGAKCWQDGRFFSGKLFDRDVMRGTVAPSQGC